MILRPRHPLREEKRETTKSSVGKIAAAAKSSRLAPGKDLVLKGDS